MDMWKLAADLGLFVTTAPKDHHSGYAPNDHSVHLRPGMSHRRTRSVLAHEIGHHVLGHRPTNFGPARSRQERSANEWAALQLITTPAYAEAEHLRDGHVESMAFDLDVAPELVVVYRSLLLRTDTNVYVDPHHGAGQWVDRTEVVA